MLIFILVYIFYTLYMNLIKDPKSTSFLSHKTVLRESFDLPLWLNIMYVHVMFACLAMLTGAVNFSKRMLTGIPKVHKLNGYFYFISVLIVTLTSGYMAPYSTGGRIVSIAFNIVNIIWPAMTVIAIAKARRKQYSKHQEWIIRSYLFCFTNLFIHLITSACTKGFGLVHDISYTIGVYGAIVLNLVIAELIIRFRKLPYNLQTPLNKNRGNI
ncbi:hypothetical protein AXI59_07705 [Bacillus nakamurai]|uniref:DUF2306 domain-containing protein n=1 Tax=Bacillus nakamurai TaxID=1793963 RepID=UPI00077857D7|nr:DUF2306 domain-containing protein [Bacillus nakamurai]KXZ23907.1 hypothetical protein AXI59_07705 [Bacillus nakamurai]